MSILASILLLAAAVTPEYETHNNIAGDTPTMKNIQSWAATVNTKAEAPATETALAYHANHTAVVVQVTADGTLTADVTGWTEGQSQTAVITLASGASVASDIVLVGYTSWVTDAAFLAECVYLSGKVYVYPVTSVK